MLKSSQAFAQAYAQLNPEQKVAVDTIDGPVMVIAGPGTGKTQVLATRIANILLKTDTNPYAILALTFTESAAKNMRERLVQLIGPTAYSIRVQTFHGFCDEVIRSHPEYFPLRPESEVLSDLERYDILETLLENTQLTALRTLNSPYHYLSAIIKAISDLKREGVSEVKFGELVAAEEERLEHDKSELKKTELQRREKNLAKMKELVLIYTQYQQQLRSRDRYDYDDMIAFVAEAFANEETLLLEYQEKLTYFLVDEYQDTNAAQNRVVDLLASYWGDKANIFVVGDPHQSIYRFQGASLENTLNFAARYPGSTMVRLTVGYRCPQVIYEAAAQVISQNEQTEIVEGSSPMAELSKTILRELAHPLKSTQPDGKLIGVLAAPSSQLEVISVVEEVRKLLESGVKAQDIAILYKKNAEALDYQIALEKWGIEFNVDGGNDVLQDEHIQQFLQLCKVIADIRSGKEGYELFEVMNYSWLALDHVLVMRVARAASKTNMTMYERIVAGYAEFCKLQFCEDVTAMDFALLEDFVTRLVKWGQQDAEMIFPNWFELVMNESGFLNWLLAQPEKTLRLHHLNALFRQVRMLSILEKGMNLERFLEALNTMQLHGISIVAEELQVGDDAVTLSTVHKAKGREWEYVFLVGCIDGKWGNTRKMSGLPLPEGILVQTQSEERDRNEDDRRLFYVALTRAKKQVVLSYPETTVNGNKASLALGSMFIEEIAADHREALAADDVIKNADEFLGRLLQPAPPRESSERERAWFTKLISDFKLSVTALNTYLRSPKVFIEDVLLKVPRTKPEYQAFGTAMHAALELMYQHILQKSVPPAESEVLTRFTECLATEVLSQEQFEVRNTYGRKVLHQYYEQYAHQPAKVFAIEKFFGYGWSNTMLGDIPLVGRVDRMDVIDLNKKTVCVIDYKTGRAKTVNEIEGKVSITEFSERELSLPENIRGPYKRQLLFYKLLTQLDPTFKVTVEEGTFDFVEPDDQGKFTRRSFALLDEDVEALKELIQQVMKEIRNLEFLETTST